MDTSTYRAELDRLRNVIKLGHVENAMSAKERRTVFLDLVDAFGQILDAMDTIRAEVEPMADDVRALRAKNEELCARLEALGADVSDEDRDPPAARPH